MKLNEFKAAVAKLEAPDGDDPEVLVEVFDGEGENHLAALRTLDFESRCSDDDALFLGGDISTDQAEVEREEDAVDETVEAESSEEEKTPAHVDTYIWNRIAAIDKSVSAYAQWMLMHFRLPAAKKMDWDKFIADRKLFCTYQGKRYRVTGASRFGDVWLAEDHTRDCGYDHRVAVDECSEWAPDVNPVSAAQPSPEPEPTKEEAEAFVKDHVVFIEVSDRKEKKR